MEPYRPEVLPIKDLDHTKLIGLVGEANAALARYDGLLQGLVNPDVLLSPLTNQEAVLSSKIEGTQATIEEVLEHEAGREYEEHKQYDIQEILNYRRAMHEAAAEIIDRPISLSTVRGLHRILMESVRGQDKTPGEFRTTQNWIGRPGCTIEEAIFVPPSPLQMQDYLQAWEAYLSQQDFDVLSQAGISHAQFELIHPFRDGNGRIGRLLIPLFLVKGKCLHAPLFYLSEYLESHREEYYTRLNAISRERDWTGWLLFFLRATRDQAQINTERVQKIHSLYESMKDKVRDLTHSQYSIKLVDCLFGRPIFRIGDIKKAEIPRPTAHTLVAQLLGAKLIQTLRPASGRRPAVYIYRELLVIAEGNDK